MLSNQEITTTLLTQRMSLTAFVATITRNYHLAEDVFQDVCVKAIGRGGEFESPDHLLNWAHLTARHRAIDMLKARDARYSGLNVKVIDALSALWQRDQEETDRVEEEALQHCLRQLTPNNREILRLRYFEGISGGEVARKLGRKLETVYQALSRIHKTLAECVRQRMQTIEGDV